MSANESNDHDLENLLADGDAVRQEYRVASLEEPPIALDEAIRAAARREVKARPHALGSRIGAWRVPVSLAAIVLLSATITTMVWRYEGHRGQIDPEKFPAPPPSQAASESKPPERNAAPAFVPEQDRLETRSAKRLTGAPVAPAPSPKVVEDALKSEADSRPTAAPALPTARENSLSSLRTAPKDDLSEKKEPRGPGAVPQPSAQALSKSTNSRATSAGQLTSGQSSVASPRAVPEVAPWEESPESWLTHIDELRVAGRTVDAEASFRTFRSRYPDYKLPPGFATPPYSNGPN